MKVFNINEHGGHLGHDSCTIFINFFPTSQGGSTRNLALIGLSLSEKKMFDNNDYILYIAPGQGQTTPWSQIVFINNIILLI